MTMVYFLFHKNINTFVKYFQRVVLLVFIVETNSVKRLIYQVTLLIYDI